METVGFVQIRKNATTCKGAENPQEFMGQMCRVMEFDCTGGALVVNPNGTALAMFDKEDILSSFKCGYRNGVVTPPDLTDFEMVMYMAKVHSRKGGYNDLLCRMVIAASLHKGTFTDSFLWQMQ